MVVADASFCKECGAPLSAESVRLARDLGWKPLIAAALSIVPGLGHLYRGHPLKALAWFLGVSAAYSAQPLGFILHLVCSANAALTGAIREKTLARASRADRPRSWSGALKSGP